jgi:hypothetical protein
MTSTKENILEAKKPSLYIASSWRNVIQPGVVATFRSLGFDVYDFKNPPNRTGFSWREVDPDWKGWTTEAYIKALESPAAKQGYESDWNAMVAADGCVLVLPCGRSAHIEAGYFVGAKKTLHIYIPEQQEPELMYKMATSISSTYDHLISVVCKEYGVTCG